MMRDRRKELIRQWLKEPTVSEQESKKRGNVELHHHNHHPEPEYTSLRLKHHQTRREGGVEMCGRFWEGEIGTCQPE